MKIQVCVFLGHFVVRGGIPAVPVMDVLVGHRRVAGSYNSSDHDRRLRSTVQ